MEHSNSDKGFRKVWIGFLGLWIGLILVGLVLYAQGITLDRLTQSEWRAILLYLTAHLPVFYTVLLVLENIEHFKVIFIAMMTVGVFVTLVILSFVFSLHENPNMLSVVSLIATYAQMVFLTNLWSVMGDHGINRVRLLS